VAAAQPAQLGRLEALHADAQSIDTRRPEATQVAPVTRAGVDLEGQLGVGRDAEAGVHRGQDALDLRRRQQRRRASAQVDASQCR
jgi:hypothetical protein